MKNIVILGGTGYTGKLIARHLLEQSDSRVIIAARRLEKSQAFVDELNKEFPGVRASAVYADAADAASLITAFKDN